MPLNKKIDENAADSLHHEVLEEGNGKKEEKEKEKETKEKTSITSEQQSLEV